MLYLRDLQDIAGRPRFHNRRAGRHLSGVRQAETDVNVAGTNKKTKIKTKHRITRKKHNEQQQQQNDILKRCVLGIELEAKINFEKQKKTHDVEEEDEALHRVVQQNKCQTGGHLALEQRVSKWRPCFHLKRARLFIYI